MGWKKDGLTDLSSGVKKGRTDLMGLEKDGLTDLSNGVKKGRTNWSI